MRPLDETSRYRALFQIGSHLLCRGLRVVILRKGLFQVFQFAHKGVEFHIGNHRGIIYVIPLAILPKHLSELVYSSFSRDFVHNLQRYSFFVFPTIYFFVDFFVCLFL